MHVCHTHTHMHTHTFPLNTLECTLIVYCSAGWRLDFCASFVYLRFSFSERQCWVTTHFPFDVFTFSAPQAKTLEQKRGHSSINLLATGGPCLHTLCVQSTIILLPMYGRPNKAWWKATQYSTPQWLQQGHAWVSLLLFCSVQALCSNYCGDSAHPLLARQTGIMCKTSSQGWLPKVPAYTKWPWQFQVLQAISASAWQ